MDIVIFLVKAECVSTFTKIVFVPLFTCRRISCTLYLNMYVRYVPQSVHSSG